MDSLSDVSAGWLTPERAGPSSRCRRRPSDASSRRRTTFPTRGCTWVDEQVVGARSERRLVRAHLDTGESVVLARWTSLGKNGKLFLQSDQGGRFLLLAATSGKGMGAHVIVRLDVSGAGAPSVAGLHLGPHPLLLGPLVDPAGYSVVVRRQGRARLERAPRLEALEGVWLSGVGKTLHDCVE